MTDYTQTVAYKSLVYGSSNRVNDMVTPFDLVYVDWSKVPRLEDIDDQIWQEIKRRPHHFDMSMFHQSTNIMDDGQLIELSADELLDGKVTLYDEWSVTKPVPVHACKTKHCRAGFVIMLAGKKGLKLEQRMHSAATAAAAIYIKSRPDEPVPSFEDGTDNEAREDIKACAARQRLARKEKKKAKAARREKRAKR